MKKLKRYEQGVGEDAVTVERDTGDHDKREAEAEPGAAATAAPPRTGDACWASALQMKFKGLDREAIDMALQGVTMYENHPCYELLLNLCRNFEFPEEERKTLRNSGDASSLFLLGYLLRFGLGGFQADSDASRGCFSAGAALGHLYCAHWQASSASTKQAATAMADNADAGCALSCLHAGYRLALQADYRRAAHYYQKGVSLHNHACKPYLDRILRNHRMDAAPWGLWVPDPNTHCLMPSAVRKTIWSFMLMSNRLRFPEKVRLEIVSLIATKSRWNSENLSGERTCKQCHERKKISRFPKDDTTLCLRCVEKNKPVAPAVKRVKTGGESDRGGGGDGDDVGGDGVSHKFCIECGGQLIPGAKFCSSCGVKLLTE